MAFVAMSKYTSEKEYVFEEWEILSGGMILNKELIFLSSHK